MKNKKHSLNYLLTPDYVFDTYADVTPEFLSSIGIRALLIDIDNTLAPYEQDLPDEKTVAWFNSMAEADIACTLISNNHADRVDLFNSLLHLPAFADSGKPGTKYFIEGMKQMERTPEETAGLGDQLLTDTLAVHRLGMVSIIVPPINDKKNLFFRFKRWLEKPFMRRYRKLHSKESEALK